MSVIDSQFTSFPEKLPYRFQITKKQRRHKAKEMLQPDKSAYNLRKALGNQAYLHNFKHHNLSVPKEYTDKKLIYVEEVLELWIEAIAKRFPPPYFYSLEVGVEGQLHAHIVGRRVMGYQIAKGKRVVEKITNTYADWQRVIAYGYKTPVPLTEDFDRIEADKLPDWQERLEDYYQALERVKKLKSRYGYRKQVYRLSDYVL